VGGAGLNASPNKTQPSELRCIIFAISEVVMHTQRYITFSLAAAVGWASLAIAQNQNEKQQPMPTVTETSTPSNPNAAILSDGNIVAVLNEVNMADSAGGAMALPKATRTDVKEFAKLMMGDHHALHVETEHVATAQHITAAAPANDPFKAAIANENQALTSAAKGRAFDSTYIAQEVDMHKAVIAWADTAETDAENSALESLIKKASPVIHRHLAKAEAIEKMIDSRTTAVAR
jgi:putative membrane protein